MQTILRHAHVDDHFLVQFLRFRPFLAFALPHVHLDALLELSDALLVEFDGDVLLFWWEVKAWKLQS